MPVTITKVKGGYRVSTPGGVKSKCTTWENAQRQKRIILATEHGFKPTGAKAKRAVKIKPPARKTKRSR